MPLDKREIQITSILFIITFFTLTFKHNLFVGVFLQDWDGLARIFRNEWSYSLSLILILLSHELGHYIPARIYGLQATLPFFIPFPIGPIGTMGALIRIKEAIPNKIQLFDIGVGGPVVSLVLSLPCWILGLYLSELVPLDRDIDPNFSVFFGDSLLTYWTGQWILGPYNPKDYDILIHPLAKAGWVGLIITAINLLPFGQLDGGHIIYSLFGERYRNWIHYLFIGFLMLALWNFTWVVWGFLIVYFIKIEHPFVPDHPTKNLDKARIFLGGFMLISLFFIFVPSPIHIGIDPSDNSLLLDLINLILGR